MIHPIPLSLTTDSINMFLLVQVSSGLFNTTYAIPRATTIPADSTEHKVRRVSVAVPGRNRTLFHCIIRPHYHFQTAVAREVKGGAHTHSEDA